MDCCYAFNLSKLNQTSYWPSYVGFVANEFNFNCMMELINNKALGYNVKNASQHLQSTKPQKQGKLIILDDCTGIRYYAILVNGRAAILSMLIFKNTCCLYTHPY